VAFGAFLTGTGVRPSIQAGMSLAQIGEFSFILASLGIGLGATREFLFPIAVAVSAVTTLTTPWSIAASGRVAARVDARLPRSVQTAAALYGSWIEGLRTTTARDTAGQRVRRFARTLLLDAALVAGVIIGTSLAAPRLSALLADRAGLRPDVARTAILVAGAAAALPFCVGLLRNGRRVGLALASAALPEAAEGRPDLAAAPRRALLSILQLGTAFLVLLPVVAVTQPFLPSAPGAALVAVAVLFLGIAFWRSAADLQGHVRAGAQVIVEALAKEAAAADHADGDALFAFRTMFPGMGAPTAARIPPTSTAVGRTLSELGVRGTTGATVLAIARGEASVMVPTAHEVLRAGDVLALAGTQEAVDAARTLLQAEPVGDRRAAPGAA
jgi:CPA2 family monovalent cation:H+ antiporter-2